MANALKFRVHFTNHGYSCHYASEQDARNAVRDAYFDATIYESNELIASWKVFGGWRDRR